jgi:TIR domain
MSDLFISYAATDREIAKRLAARLDAEGWSVWWDREIPLGIPFDRAIEDALNQTRAVVVLWSPASVGSDWVKSEASEGKRKGLPLLQVVIRTTEIPLEFRRIQAVDLTGWPQVSHEEAFQRFLAGLRTAVPLSPTPAKTEPTKSKPAAESPPAGDTTRLGHPAVEKLLSNSYERWRSGSVDHLFAASKHARATSRDEFIDGLNASWGVLLRAALRGRVVTDDEFVVVASASFVLTSEMLYVFDQGQLGRVIAVTLRDVVSFSSSGWWTKTLCFELESGERVEIGGMEEAPKEHAIISLLRRSTS